MKNFSRSYSQTAGRFPSGTLAAYGLDNTLATKLVVSVFDPGRRDPSAMRTWTMQAVDVRHDPAIAADVARFLQQHIEALPVFPELRRAFDEGLIDRHFIRPSELDEVEAAPRGRLLERTRERTRP